MRKRQSNRPERRFIDPDAITTAEREALCHRLRYVGAAYHKRSPGDYRFTPPSNPRPTKSLCDDKRVILKEQALQLFRDGVRKSMISALSASGVSKYVWAVDQNGDAYEAKTHPNHEISYHGYRLGEDDNMRDIILREWIKR